MQQFSFFNVMIDIRSAAEWTVNLLPEHAAARSWESRSG
jgi:hypothetical protein